MRLMPLVTLTIAAALGSQAVAWASAPLYAFDRPDPSVWNEPVATAGNDPLLLAANRDDSPPPSVFDLPGRQAGQPSIYDVPGRQAGTTQPASAGPALRPELRLTYLTDHVHRGLIRDTLIAHQTAADARRPTNFLLEGRLSLDTDDAPHPFISLLANVVDDDPETHLQEIWPTFGADWRIDPLSIEVGHTYYILPDRHKLNTSEVYLKLTLLDGQLLNREDPILSPYILAAYDYDRYDGWYFELGLSHEFLLPDLGLALTPLARIAYVQDHRLFAGHDGKHSGWQHYDIGVVTRYGLNTLLNIPDRTGQISLTAYLFYTDGLDDDLRADAQLWGGVGIELRR